MQSKINPRSTKMKSTVLILPFLALVSSASAGYLMLTSFGREISMIDLKDGSNVRCSTPLDMVPSAAAPLFGVINPKNKKSAILCGGEKRPETLAHEHNSECFMVEPNKSGDDWTMLGRMTFGRNLATLIDMPDGRFWALGGSTNVWIEDHIMPTTEFLTIEDGVIKQSVLGPRLPQGMIFMCSTHIDESHIFLAGTDLGRQYAYIVDLNTFEFNLIEVSRNRLGAMCGRIESDGEEYVALFGGYTPPYGMDIASALTELYNIRTGEVTRAEDMPKAVFAGTYSETDGSQIVMAGGMTGLSESWGFSFNTYSFDGKKWTKLPQYLTNAFGRNQGIYFEDFTC